MKLDIEMELDMDMEMEMDMDIEMEVEVEVDIEVEVEMNIGMEVEVEVKVEMEMEVDVEMDNFKLSNMTERLRIKTNYKYAVNKPSRRSNFDGNIHYISEISKSNKDTQMLNKLDIRDLYRLSEYYGYDFNKRRQTIYIDNKQYNVLRIKNKLYAKSSENLINLNKLIKLTKALRASKLDCVYKLKK